MAGDTFSFSPSRVIQARPPRLPQQAVPSQSRLATSRPRFTSQKQEDTLGGAVQGLEPEGLGLNPSSSLTVYPPAGLGFFVRRVGTLAAPSSSCLRGTLLHSKQGPACSKPRESDRYFFLSFPPWLYYNSLNSGSQREQFETHGQPRVDGIPVRWLESGLTPWEALAGEGVFAQRRIRIQFPEEGSQGKVDSEWAEGHSCAAHGHLAAGTVRPTAVPLSGPHETREVSSLVLILQGRVPGSRQAGELIQSPLRTRGCSGAAHCAHRGKWRVPASPPHVSSVAVPSLILLSFVFQHDFHFLFFLEDGFSLVLEDLAPPLGFGAGHGIAPMDRSWGRGYSVLQGAAGIQFLPAWLPGAQVMGIPLQLGKHLGTRNSHFRNVPDGYGLYCVANDGFPNVLA